MVTQNIKAESILFDISGLWVAERKKQFASAIES